MISIIGGRAEIVDMRKKSCLYVGLWKFKELELLHFGTGTEAIWWKSKLLKSRSLQPRLAEGFNNTIQIGLILIHVGLGPLLK